MDESTKRDWDVRLGIAAPALTVAGLLIGVWQFNAGEEHRRRAEHQASIERDDREFRHKLWLQRLETYQEVARLAGNVVAHANDQELPNAISQFTSTYWGAMILVEDTQVERAMIAFNVEIQDFLSGWSTLDRLKARTDELVNVCRASEHVQANVP